MPAIEFQDPARDIVEEVTVVGNENDTTLVFLQVMLEPGDGLGVEMVRRFVEQQQVRRLEKQAAEGHTTLLAA